MTQRAGIWSQLSDLVSKAQERVVIVAPFIKAPIFAELIASVPAAVSTIQCVTRWSISDVAAGVSDPEIIELVASDKRLAIHLCHMLHAKIFLGDERALIGSANITGRATGKATPANIEILVEIPAGHSAIDATMKVIGSCWVPATAELALLIRQQANILAVNVPSSRQLLGEGGPDWTPITRSPDRLFPVYSGRPHDYPASVLAGVVEDLAVLDIQPGYDFPHFRDIVKDRLHGIPEVRALRERGSIAAPDLEEMLRNRLDLSNDRARNASENLASWLGYFDDYMITPAGYWEIQRGKIID